MRKRSLTGYAMASESPWDLDLGGNGLSLATPISLSDHNSRLSY